MNSFGIVYTLDIGPTPLLPSKIHYKFTSTNKITKLSAIFLTSISALVKIFSSPSYTPDYVPSSLFSQLCEVLPYIKRFYSH